MDGRTRQMADRALAVAEALDDADALQTTYRNLALATGYGGGLWREALAHFEKANQILADRCAGNLRDVRYCRMKTALAHLRLGELRRLEATCDAQLREAIDRGDQIARTALQIYAKAPLLLAADEPVTARRVLDTSKLPSQGVFRLYHTSTTAETHLYEGRADAAVAVWRTWWPEYESAKLSMVPVFRIDATRGYGAALAALGDPRSLGLAERLAKKLGVRFVAGADAVPIAIRGAVAARQGHTAQAQTLYGEAAQRYESADQKLYAAACARSAALLAGDDGGVTRADAVLKNEGIIRPDRWARVFAPTFAKV